MNRLCKLLLLFLLSLLALGVASPNRCLPGNKEAKKVDAKKVPLDSIYSTSRQKGLKLIDQGQGDKAFPNEMRELYRQSIRMGASNVFLARGDDIAGAVKATWEVFTAGQSVDEPVSSDKHSRSEQFWLVGYLGVSGSGGAWLVKSAEVKGQDIRLNYVKGTSDNTDLHPYFV